eukprot:7634680-Pyramimonas_sp.AAC.1
MNRATRQGVVDWEERVGRSYHYGSTGRSCGRAVWEQALAAEFGDLVGIGTGVALVDLTKAHEKRSCTLCWPERLSGMDS